MVSCERCGRTLTNPHSINRGYGSYCAAKVGAGYGTSTWQHSSSQRNAQRRSKRRGGGQNQSLLAVSPTLAVNLGVNLLARSVPPVGALMAVYDVVQASGQIASITNQAKKTYEATGSVEEVARKVGPKVMNLVYEQCKSQIIDTIVPGDDLASIVANSALRSIL